MKKRIFESKIGIGYLSNVISTCEQNGIECIVDDKNGDIYYYDPKGRKYGDDKLLHDNDVRIWDIVEDEELFDAILFDASGAIFKDFAVKWNELQKKGERDEVYKTKVCRPIIGKYSESKAKNGEGRFFTKAECLKRDRLSKAMLAKSGGLNARIAPWYAKTFPTDKEMIAELRLCRSTFQDVVDALDNGHDVYDAIGVGDSIVRERVFGALCDLTGKDYDYFYDKWLNGGERYSRFSENLDDPRDWSASEGEVEIMWDTDEYEDFGIFKGEGSTYLIDYDRVNTHDDLINEVCRMIGKEYPDLDFGTDDFIIVNEDEFWEQRGGDPGKWEDDD